MEMTQAILERLERKRWRGGRSFLAADGSWVHLTGDFDDGKPWSCSFQARGPRLFRGFDVTELGMSEGHIAHWLKTREVRERSYRGRPLLTAHNPEQRASIAVWQGPWHELHTWTPGPEPKVEQIARDLDSFELRDTPDGMLVRPRAGTQIEIQGPIVYRHIPGAGLLSIEDARTAAPLPTWAGSRTPHGEVWRRRLGQEVGGAAGGSEALVLLTLSAVAQVVRYEHVPDMTPVTRLLETLNVRWTPAS